MALVGGPDLLILDEPINGLDPQGIAEVRTLLLKLKTENNMTIMISSHILEELYKVADTFGIIHEGRLIQELTREELSSKCSEYIELKLRDAAAASVVIEKYGIQNYRVVSNDTIHIYEQLEKSAEINMELAKADCMVDSVQITQEKLENYFLELTGGKEDA